jgi:hypothetical protein
VKTIITTKAAIIAVVSGLTYATPADADYGSYVSQERAAANNFFNLTTIFQFFGILTEATNGGGRLEGSSTAPARDVPDSSQNLGTSERARRGYNRALDEIDAELNRHLNR